MKSFVKSNNLMVFCHKNGIIEYNSFEFQIINLNYAFYIMKIHNYWMYVLALIFIWIIFDRKNAIRFIHLCNEYLDVPCWQFCPIYPSGHWHVYLFTWSLHVPPCWHGLLPHSSISKQKKWCVHTSYYTLL